MFVRPASKQPSSHIPSAVSGSRTNQGISLPAQAWQAGTPALPINTNETKAPLPEAWHTVQQRRKQDAPSSTIQNSPIQFTLKDAQLKWEQWYKSGDVSLEKITRYIKAKKRGWVILNRELNKPAVAPIGMDTSDNEEEEQLPDAIVESSDEEDEEQLNVHPEDEELIGYIIGKQYTKVSDSSQKLETDTRKYKTAAGFAKKAMDKRREVAIPLNAFFKKNAPAGYNTSVENEDEEVTEYQYDVRHERDFTFGLPENPLTARREKTDYFRAPFSHKHIVRAQQDNELRKFLKDEFPGKKKAIASKQVYLSFNVEPHTGNTLRISNVSQSYSNSNMLGSKSGQTLVQHRISIAGHDLIMWVNKDSAGHQSRYNASAIVPNLIQYEQILQALDISPIAELEPSGEIEEKTFRSDTRKALLDKEDPLPTNNYKKKMLNDRRQLVTAVSGAINANVTNNYLRAITAAVQQDFLQYPCLVLEPLANYAADFNIEPKNLVDELKKDIIHTLHTEYDISFANRASFGFAYPTVGDVGVSVRIWPGLIPGVSFSNMILDVLKTAGLLDGVPDNPVVDKKREKEPLVLALKLAIIRAQKRFRRYHEIKEENGDVKNRSLYKWVNDRITSNVIKAQTLIGILGKRANDLQVTRRAIRTLENLNEYDLIQAGVEEQQHQGQDQIAARTTSLSTAFKQRSQNRVVSGYELVSENIRSSGMDAYRVAVQTIGDTHTDSSRLYYETSKVNLEIGERSGGLVKAGSVTKMQDPSYNFVNQQDAQSNNTYKWSRDKNFPSVQIYDITNTPIAVALSKAKATTTQPSLIVCFESFSKHFQLGMDKTTIGRLIVYVKTDRKNQAKVQVLVNRFKQVGDTPFPNFFLNYLAMQNELYGE